MDEIGRTFEAVLIFQVVFCSNNTSFISFIHKKIAPHLMMRSYFRRFGLTCKPDSVEGNHSSRRYVTITLKQPTRFQREPRLKINDMQLPAKSTSTGTLFGLALSGVYPATDVTISAVRSYRHLFTLTQSKSGGIFSAALSVGFRLPGVYLALCSVKSGLSSA